MATDQASMLASKSEVLPPRHFAGLATTSNNPNRLEAECAMRPKTNKLERIGVGLTIDQHQIGSDMTVSITAPGPLPRESVISILYGQGLVSNQRFENGAQQVVELRPVLC